MISPSARGASGWLKAATVGIGSGEHDTNNAKLISHLFETRIAPKISLISGSCEAKDR